MTSSFKKELDRSALGPLSLVVVQQLVVSLSTVWVARLVEGAENGQSVVFWLILYLGSFLAAYFPVAGALVLLAKAKAKCQTLLIEHFADLGRGRVSWWSDTEKRKRASTLLAGEAPTVIANYIDYLYYMGQALIVVGLNLTTLGIVVEPLFFGSYFFGLFLAFSVLYLQYTGKVRLSLKAQQGRVKWLSVVMTAWDNVVLNNLHNFHIWFRQIEKRGERFRKKMVHLSLFTQGMSLVMSFCLFIPTMVLILYFSNDLKWLTLVIVTLPRLFEVLTYSYEALYYAADFPQQQAQLATVISLLEVRDSPAILDRISWDKITVFGPQGTIQAPNEFWRTLPRSGRYTVRGANGAGKSSLLQQMKADRPDDSYYLPTHHTLLFRTPAGYRSTGERIKSALSEIFSHSNASILLLDEWDANLDDENREIIDRILGELSVKYCIVESRHYN